MTMNKLTYVTIRHAIWQNNTKKFKRQCEKMSSLTLGLDLVYRYIY